jgi:hypothetical protein
MLIDRAACTVVAHSAQHARHAPLGARDPSSPGRHRRGLAPTASRFPVGAACACRRDARPVLRAVVRRRRRNNRIIPPRADAARASVRGAAAHAAAPARTPRAHCRCTRLYLRCSGGPYRCCAPRVADPHGASRSRRGTRGGGRAGIQGPV